MSGAGTAPSGDPGTATAGGARRVGPLLAAAAGFFVAPLALVAFLVAGLTATLVTATGGGAPGGDQLNIDAIPAHARYLAGWVIRAGTRCQPITAPMIAAQIDLESSWRADAVAHNPPERGGDAVGIAQFQTATWAAWGGDYDHDGNNSPADPEDAIIAMGRLMCDLATWAQRGVDAATLHGNVLDLAWAAYFCGRGCISDAGGVPTSGATHDYPQQVRARIDKYRLAAVPAGTGGWRVPLPPGSYQLTSRFRPADRPNHDGIDLAADTGTPITAAAAGIVLEAGCDSAYCDRPGNANLPGCGLLININHGGGIATRYCHAVKLNVTAGTQVAAGQIIAWVGSTGNSSGPHLHFEVHTGAPPLTSANAVDPAAFLKTVGVSI